VSLIDAGRGDVLELPGVRAGPVPDLEGLIDEGHVQDLVRIERHHGFELAARRDDLVRERGAAIERQQVQRTVGRLVSRAADPGAVDHERGVAGGWVGVRPRRGRPDAAGVLACHLDEGALRAGLQQHRVAHHQRTIGAGGDAELERRVGRAEVLHLPARLADRRLQVHERVVAVLLLVKQVHAAVRDRERVEHAVVALRQRDPEPVAGLAVRRRRGTRVAAGLADGGR
jgi:hypothetical protein